MRTKVQLQLSTNFAWRVSAHHRGMHNNTNAHSLCKISADLCCFLKGHWLDDPLVSQTQTRKRFGRSLAALTSPAPFRATDWFHFNDGGWLGLRWPRHTGVPAADAQNHRSATVAIALSPSMVLMSVTTLRHQITIHNCTKRKQFKYSAS
jgi:hypothetical protein